MSDPNVYVCTIATNSSLVSPHVLENLPRFEHSSQNVTCGYNLTMQSLHCYKLNESVTETLGVFHLYNNESGGANVSLYLSWDARQEVVSVSWTELLDIHFTCLAGGGGRDDQEGESSLPYNIAGSAMAVMVIVLFVITVWQTVKKRKQQEEKMKSSSVAVEEEVEKEERNMSSQAQLVMEENNGFEMDECKIDVRL